MNTYIVALGRCSNCQNDDTEFITDTRLCTSCNRAKLGTGQKTMLNFAEKHLQSGTLHSLANDRDTQRIAQSLVNRGLIVVNEYNQFTLAKE